MREVESLFIEANRAIDEKDLAEAKEILEDILAIEPSYGRAHNHLAWIYETELRDFEKACMHYKLAIKFAGKDYPVAYVNYIYLLLDMEQYNEVSSLILEASDVKGIRESILYYQQGRVLEASNHLTLAYEWYKKAKKTSFDNSFIQILKLEIQRVLDKMNVFQKLYAKIWL